jgi:hypothetical protein
MHELMKNIQLKRGHKGNSKKDKNVTKASNPRPGRIKFCGPTGRTVRPG